MKEFHEPTPQLVENVENPEDNVKKYLKNIRVLCLGALNTTETSRL